MRLALATMLLLATLPLVSRAALAVDYGAGDNAWLKKDMTKEELLPVMEKASDYFVRNQLADGQFVYIKDPMGKCCRDKKEKYSLIRHHGGVYALLRTYERSPDKKYLAAAKAGIEFSLRFRESHEGLMVVKGLRGAVDFGENGFLLINTVLFDKLSGTSTYKDVSQDLSEFLTKALVYNGPMATTGQWAECQAIIGLAHFYKHQRQDPAIIQVTTSWLASMKAQNKSSHWSIQAINWIASINPDLDRSLLEYGVESGKSLLKNVVISGTGDGARYVGSRKRKFNSCGVTARNEGLIAAYALARKLGREPDASMLLQRVKEHLAFAMQFQYGLPGNLYEADPEMTRIGKIFDMDGAVFDNPRFGYVRVDYVSHHIRAMAAFLDLPNAPVSAGLKMKDLDYVGEQAKPAH